MSGIHFNVEAAEAFCSQVRSRREALAERRSDEQTIYDDVFDGWRDHRAEGVKTRLAELGRNVEAVSAELDDLVAAVQRQIRAAQEYLGGSEVW